MFYDKLMLGRCFTPFCFLEDFLKNKMNIKLLSIAIIGSMVISGCLPTKVPVIKTRIVKTAEIKLNEVNFNPLRNEGIKITMKPIFGKATSQFPQLIKTSIPFNFIKKEKRWSHKYKQNVWKNIKHNGNLVNFPMLPLPIFEVSITNSTKHVMKLSNAIMALEDSAGNIFDALNKKDARQYVKQALRSALIAKNAPNDKINSAVNIADLHSDLLLIHLIDHDFKVLPGRTKKGFLAFNYGNFTNKDFKKFIYEQVHLNIQLLEIPVNVDKAGKAAETTNFSFNFDVKINSKEEKYTTYVWK
ncbi:hypothetical protein BTHERMOSOX_597 [Bathymodiolus thermophilus thioautotrophic gill symbiont]|uniref:Uncharacterized protein n=2 Tax=Bathymodiolus thermophilus thioautotrophic gill symbiont TaxID=2360 RepID=A0A1J5TVE2_9GAMM|nr:hypothetical protein BGC33_14380 [Bathymodiolus thermophilus thioautotrophic gill symbiont]SGZ72547.1 hypothetical protein BTHERMOSOX_597 [Bathymodiolus thermophilus thioautotrophic gill symbiont]